MREGRASRLPSSAKGHQKSLDLRLTPLLLRSTFVLCSSDLFLRHTSILPICSYASQWSKNQGELTAGFALGVLPTDKATKFGFPHVVV
ncbi:hypothetical protein SLA2020_472120 [Shorea laevis]